ncbi:hypothetical protein [Paenibacillus oleatilyticus]|uniref:Uncharacterized protein n=1 Tax=Paenibacillus oleatilyticus TaxID=2594886 RepID=A0ABV4V7V4_9BACL
MSLKTINHNTYYRLISLAEHINKTTSNKHCAFLDSLCNIAKEKVIKLNPFDYEGSSDWLNLIYEITEANWAKEHAECTMPILEDMERFGQSRGYSHKIIPTGSKMLSISLVFMEHYAKMLGRQNE